MKNFLIVLGMMVFANSAFGKDSSSGCGPAWYVFKDKTLLSSALRATTNGILTPIVTLGMTFGTSNCANHKIVENDKRAIHFATASLETLRHDIAKAKGTWLNAYSETLNCNALANHELGQQLQKNYTLIFASQDPVQVVATTKGLIETNPFLKQQCSST